MGMKLRDGRLLCDDETAPVVVVNEALARRFFPGARAVGRRVRHEGDNLAHEIFSRYRRSQRGPASSGRGDGYA